MSKRKLTDKKVGDIISSQDWDTLNQTLHKVSRIIDLLPVYMRKSDEGVGVETSSRTIIEWEFWVDESWSDTTPHYFNNYPYDAYPKNLASIQLDQPATGHKRAFEDLSTGYCYTHGWYLKTNTIMRGKLEINTRIGAYHGADATRAWIDLVIADPATLDRTVRDDSVQWVYLRWSMSGLGYPNGSYNNPLSGYIVFTDPPSYSFSPANPAVWYNLITWVNTRSNNILYGYGDHWDTDWDIWASINRYAMFRNIPATEPPRIEALREIPLKTASAVIARWDGEYRLWIKRDTRGLIVPLGAKIKVEEDKYKVKADFNVNNYDKVYGKGEEPTYSGRLHTIKLKTDKRDRNKFSDTWILNIFEKEDSVYVAFGDETWDGDKIAYYILSL